MRRGLDENPRVVPGGVQVHVPDERLGRSLGVVMDEAQETEPDVRGSLCAALGQDRILSRQPQKR